MTCDVSVKGRNMVNKPVERGRVACCIKTQQKGINDLLDDNLAVFIVENKE